MIDQQVSSFAPFDQAAITYDEQFENNPVTQNIRAVIWRSLLKHFTAGDHILELNCGTGTDALMLAQHGIRVTGTDSSLQMIEVARTKISVGGCEEMIDLHHLSFESLERFNQKTFDGIFSNFGGLNCTEHLSEVFASVHSLLNPGGYFIACFINKFSVWEMISFLLRGKFSLAFRRLRKNGSNVLVNGEQIHLLYYSLQDLVRMIEPYFQMTTAFGLNIFSPSPNSKSFFSSHPHITDRLLSLDDLIRFARPWNGLGDHIVVEMRRI